MRRWISILKRRIGLLPPITRDRFVTWVALLVSALVVTGSLRFAVGPECSWTDPLDVLFGILGVLGAGALAILVPARFDVMSKAEDWARRLRAIGIDIQSDAFRLFVDERVLEARMKREMDGEISQERIAELTSQYLDVCHTTTDEWMRMLGEYVKQVNNICEELERKGFALLQSLHLLRQFIHAIITAEMKHPQATAWRNRRWAEISQKCFSVAQEVDSLSYAGLRGAPRLGESPPFVPPEELDEVISWVAECRLTSAPVLERDLLLARIGTLNLPAAELGALSDHFEAADISVGAFVGGEALFASERDLQAATALPSFKLLLQDEIPTGDPQVEPEKAWLGRIAVSERESFCVLILQSVYVDDGKGGGPGDGNKWEWIVAAREWVDLAVGRFRKLALRAEDLEREGESDS